MIIEARLFEFIGDAESKSGEDLSYSIMLIAARVRR